MKNIFYENMSALDKVIERYNGAHRRSIVERDVQNIYHKVFDIIEDKIFCNEEIKELHYRCKCLNSLIKVNIEFSNVEYTQCYGDINRIVLVVPIQCLDEYDNLYFINEKDTCLLGFGASLYCLFWDLVNDKSYKLNKHKYKSFNDIFDENSLEDLHDLAVLILNTKYNEENFKTVCWDFPDNYPLSDFYSFL